MNRASSIVLLCLTLFLVLMPLGVNRPGMPATMKADEPAYYLMALSLARDGDLICEEQDLARLWEEFPFAKTRNLILASGDGWHTVFFGKPYVYSLISAPMAHLFGAGGMVSVNFLMLSAMIAMGATYLRRYNRDMVATLFSAGFFLLSTGFAYVFWLQPEIFNMFGVCSCLFLGLHKPQEKAGSWWRRLMSNERFWWGCSGAALSLAAYNKPVLAVLGLPVFLHLFGRRTWKAAGIWLAGATLFMGLQVGTSMALTGHASAYLGVARVGFSVDAPDQMPVQPEQKAPGGGEEFIGTKNSWWWIFRIPELDLARLSEDIGYFLWGRHVGLLPYLPFAALAVLLFLIHGRGSPLRWGILGSLAAVALFFFLWIPFNWHGGGGFIGNRYFLNAYPAFLFLVTAIRPRALLPLAFAAGGLLLGPILMTPFGAPVPHPTLQAHARNFPFARLPLELTLQYLIPGYHGRMHSGIYVLGRKDQLLPRGEELWLHGSQRVELWLTSPEPIDSLVLSVRVPDPDHPPLLEMAGEKRQLAVGETLHQVEFHPAAPDRQLDRGPQYRLVVHNPGGRAETYLGPLEREVEFYLGSAISILGPRKLLERPLYAVNWEGCTGPESVSAEELFEVDARFSNASQEIWPATGVIRVSLAYHWLDSTGTSVKWEGRRTALPHDLAPGENLRIAQTIAAPKAPGSYVLELDPVFERVAWFSSRNDGETCRLQVEVGPREKDGHDGPY